MLHKAAQFAVRELSGNMPQTAAELRVLPGIGEYTSAAIASIAFGDPAAAIDGNVERVIMRLAAPLSQSKAGALKSVIRRTAELLLARERPGDFNQAMMELGATICLPKNPLCLQCPVQKLCYTRGEHPTPPRKEMRSKSVSYALLRRSNRKNEVEILLEQRPHESSLMAGMWELPEVESEAVDRLLLSVRHAITTTNYQVSILHFEAEEKKLLPQRMVVRKWVAASRLLDLPLTGLARKVFKRMRILPAAHPSGELSRAELAGSHTDSLPIS
jgi:A/G-specific adenine glycosylase